MNHKPTLRVCYFAVKDRNYPRYRAVASYLTREFNVEVHSVDIDAGQGFARNVYALTVAVIKCRRKFDAVILAEFSLQFALLAFLLARKNGAILVTDWFVGLYETRVQDYGTYSTFSPKAVAFWVADAISVILADVVFTDTEPRARQLMRRFHLRSHPLVVPVGAPGWATYAVPRAKTTTGLKVLYYGNYIPLHGLGLVVEGVLTIRDIRIELTFIGNGAQRSEIEKLTSFSTTGHTFKFLDTVSEHELSRYIADHEVILGVFGSSLKARTVVANKVWQGLACGRRVLTQKTDALDGLREQFPGLLYEVEASKEAVATALRQLSVAAPVDERVAETASSFINSLVSKSLEALCGEITLRAERNR